nr:hypothetical protein [Neobacillus bataviensis]
MNTGKMIQLLNPTITDVAQDNKEKAPRLRTLDGTIIGLLTNSKHKADMLMEMAIEHLRKKYAIKETISLAKKHPSEKVTLNEIQILKKCNAVLTAIGD